ncbi:MAG: hypothetical protein Tp1124SUR1244132_48, partial [Prokaryotic dsDNA virus sp.]
DFTNLGTFKVHLLLVSSFKATSAETNIAVRLSNDGGSSFISSGYQTANRIQRPVPFDNKSTSSDFMGFISQIHTNKIGNAYVYFYNLLNSNIFSYINFHGISDQNDTFATYGGGMYGVAETHNAIRCMVNSDSLVAGANLSLYGIRE